MNLKSKFAIILASTSIALGTGGGLATWQYSKDASAAHDHHIHIGDFVFNTIQIAESPNSSAGTLSKTLNSTNNIRCDGQPLGFVGGQVDLTQYFTVTPLEGVTETNNLLFSIQSGVGSISGNKLIGGATSGNIVVRASEEGYEDNYLDLTFTNNLTVNQSEHQSTRTYGTISWGSWSSYTSTSSTHTRTRTGTLSYNDNCSVCGSNLGSGSVEVNTSNYDSYATYDTTGLGATQSGSHNMVRNYGTISWGSWSGYSQYGSSQHQRTRTGTLSYTESCSDCGRSGNSGSITINSGNYSTYAQYNTSSLTYQEIANCNDNRSSYVSSSTSSTSWGSWTNSGSQYSEVTKEPTCTSTGTRTTYQDQTRSGYYYRYASGYNYYCDCCDRFMRFTGQGSTRVSTSDSRTLTVGSSTISATGHTGSNKLHTEYEYGGPSSCNAVTYDICKDCGVDIYRYTSGGVHNIERYYGAGNRDYGGCTKCGHTGYYTGNTFE